MFSDTQHENMYLNTASNLIAITLGCVAAIFNSPDLSFSSHNSLLSILSNPDTIEFLLRSAIGGAIGFVVKVGGDYALHLLKNKKKGGDHE